MESQSVLEISVLGATTGALITTLCTPASTSVAEVARLVAEASTGPSSAMFQLMHEGRVLDSRNTLLDALGFTSGAVELQAVVLPVFANNVKCTVTGATMLPVSGDVLVACRGNIGLSSDPLPIGADDGETSPLWIWRLKASEHWALSGAVLLARQRCCRYDAMQATWNCEPDAVDIWSQSELDMGKSTGVIPFPSKLLGGVWVFIHAHSEDYAIFSWNQSDWFGGMGVIDRLDINTGEVLTLARVSDVWAVVTDPTGNIFCSTCYDGTDVLQVMGSTVTEPGKANTVAILAQTPSIGFGLAYDSALGVLVATSRDGTSFFVICPPGSPAVDRCLSQPTAVLHEALRPPGEDRTPGDRSSPWLVVNLPLKSEMESIPRSNIWYSLSVFAHDGVVTFLDANSLRAVRRVPLITNGEKFLRSDVIQNDQSILSFATNGEHPIVLFSSC